MEPRSTPGGLDAMTSMMALVRLVRSRAWRDEWSELPEPPLWRAVLFALCVVLLLVWLVLEGGRVNAVPATLATLSALALLQDLAVPTCSRLRGR
jgi:hypothetical protein